MAPLVEANFLSERECAIGHLERGSIVTKYYVKKKPEKRMMAVRRETMLVVWYKASHTRNLFEGAVDVREIKEVKTRLGFLSTTAILQQNCSSK